MKNISKADYLKLEYKKINNLFLSGKFDLVIDKTKKILKKNSTQIPFYNLLALAYRETGKLLLAEETLINALTISPNDQSVLVNLGSTYRVLIEFEKSENFLKQALSMNPNNINALVNYANLKRDKNEYNDSIQLYEKAYKMNNEDTIIIINLAGVYQIVGKFELSQKLLEKLLLQHKNNALAHKMLSTIKKYEINDKHQAEMLSILQKNSFNEYDKATLCFAISKSFDDQKNYKKSSEFFKKANDIQKKIHKNYSINGEIKLFKKIKNIFQNTNFKNYPNYLFYHGLLNRILGNESKALESLTKASILANSYNLKAQIYSTISDVYASLGDNENTLNFANKITEKPMIDSISPVYIAKSYAIASHVYSVEGDNNKAINFEKKALAIYIKNKNEIPDYIKKIIKNNDMIILMGAGQINSIIDDILYIIKENYEN